MRFINHIQRTAMLLVLLLVGWATCCPVSAQTVVDVVPDPSTNLVGTDNGTVVQPLEFLDVSDYGVTFAFSKGSGSTQPAYYRNGACIRVYNGNTFTVESSVNNVMQIEFQSVAYRSNETTLSSNSGTVSYDAETLVYTWVNSDNAQTVSFNINNTQLRISSLKITFAASGEGTILKAPVFSQASCDFYQSFDLTITDINDPTATVYYTMDGSAPSPNNGMVYSSPITIPVGGDVTVKAVSVSDKGASPVTSATYHFIAKHLFSLKLPNKSGVNYVYYSSNTEYGEWHNDNSTYITEGENLYIAFGFNTGYVLRGITLNGVSQSVSGNSLNFVMPSSDVELIIDVAFDPVSPSDPQPGDNTRKYNLYLASNPVGAASLSGTGKYASDSEVYVSAYAESGYVFTGWTKDGETISTNRSFQYTMPSSDVVLTANFVFNPSSPTEPEQPALKHPLTVIASPVGAGSFDISGSKIICGEEYHVYAYPNTGYRFKGWIVNGVAQEETSTHYTGIMTEAGANIVGLFTFDPSSPSNPGVNYYNPVTGQVIVDGFTPGYLYDALNELVGYDKFPNVRSLIVKGVVKSYDLDNLSYFSNAGTLDISRVEGITALPSYTFSSSMASYIALPPCLSSIGSYAFRYCENLTTLVVLAKVPPTCNSSTFKDFTNKSNCKVYVPAESVDLYRAAEYWKDFTIVPISNEANILEVSPEDPEGWNDLSRPHRITVGGDYESSFGMDCKIQYAVDDSSEWITFVDGVQSGNSFSGTLVAMFNPNLSVHTIRLRVVDTAGNTTELTPIEYKDVSFETVKGIENKFYSWGEEIVQTSLECSLPSDQYVITNYKNNVNAGTASFNIEGVFPYTIGRKTYAFTIEPLPLSGSVEIAEDKTFVYSGSSFKPEWYFTDDKLNVLVENQDYIIEWKDNVNPGTATLRVQGINNFSGTLSDSFVIDKAQLSSGLYTLKLPSGDITYDGEAHTATSSKSNGVGEITFSYALSDSSELSENAPSEVGEYDIYVEIADGTLYYGLPLSKVGSFTIYQFDESDWAVIQTIVPSLTQKGWTNPWDISKGISSASSLEGLVIEEGHVVGVNLGNQGLMGEFPLELLSFNRLKSLIISNNVLSGALETVSAFAAQNPEMFAQVESIDISGNDFSGNVGAFAAVFPALVYLNASDNHISDVYPVIASRVSTLNLKHQTLDRTLEIDLTNLTVESLVKQIPTILFYDHGGQSFDKNLRLSCTADDGWNIVMAYTNGQIKFEIVSKQNAYMGNSGDLLDVVALSSDGYSADAYMSMRLYFETGDANFDGDVSVLDLQSTILYAFDDYHYYPFNFTAADTYSDKMINVQDVICTANILLSSGGQDDRMPMRMIAQSDVDESEACVYIEDNKVYLNSSRPVAAIDIMVDGDADWDMGQYGLMAESNHNHLIGYSMSGLTLPIGTILLGEISGGSRIVKCVLSDEYAQPIGVTLNKAISGIDSIGNSDDNERVIYDLNGRRLKSPGNGVNIIIDRNGVAKKSK